MNMNPHIIEVKGLNVSYDKKNVLTNVYLNIEAGHAYGIIGPNGAGKSTLFKAILGLVEPSHGSVTVYGGKIENARKKIAYIPQKDLFDQDFPATVFDIVLMGRYPHKKIFQKINDEDRQKASEAMKAMQIENLGQRQIGQLSGGQQQRVYIARALCQEAEIFFLDEPFAGVDAMTEESIVNIMHTLKAQGKTFLLVHHDLTTVQQYFDKIILINQRLIGFGDTEKLFTQQNLSLCYGSQLSILHKIQQL
jgi:ABC-type Mn2+/Zn2+ transport system ATPase subunit